MADTQEHLLTVETSLIGTDYVRFVKDPAGTEQSSNIELRLFLDAVASSGRYKIVPTISANNLVFTLTRVNGSNPSSSLPIKFRVGDSEYSLEATTTFTKNAGTNWFNMGSTELAAQPVDLFVYAIGETGAAAGLKFGYGRIAHARTMSDFINTLTSEKYIAGNWTNFNATDPVSLIGRFRAQLSAGAAYTWSIPASVVVNRPIYETDWLSWIPVHTGFAGGSDPTNITARYKVTNDFLNVVYRCTGSGTSNAAFFTISLPFTSKNVTSFVWAANGSALDNGVVLTTPAYCRVQNNTNIMDVFKDWTATNIWTTSGGKRLANMSVMIFEL